MKISNFMSKNAVTLDPDRPVRDALRKFYNLGVSAILITEKKKLVGILTEEDILQSLFPSIKEFMEDFTHARSVNYMEEELTAILDKPIRRYMVRDLKCVAPDTSLMRAQSMMLVNKFSHMPVVDDNHKLMGIISQGDIFKALVSAEVPYDDEEEYHDWLSYHFDYVSKKLGRYSAETDSIDRELKKHNVTTIVDVGNGTGSHDMLLAKQGYDVTGIDRSKRMYRVARKKWKESSGKIQERLKFEYVKDYAEFFEEDDMHYDGAIMMGSSLAHLPNRYNETLSSIVSKLREKNSVLILQVANYHKIFNTSKRLRSFGISKSELSENHEYAFTEFYDPPKKGEKNMTLTMSVLANKGKRWRQSAINSTSIVPLTSEWMEKELKKHGFSTIRVYGSKYGEPLFDSKLDLVDDDWMNVVATR